MFLILPATALCYDCRITDFPSGLGISQLKRLPISISRRSGPAELCKRNPAHLPIGAPVRVREEQDHVALTLSDMQQ